MPSNYITSPKIKFGVEDGIFTRTSLVLAKPKGKTLRVSSFRHFDLKYLPTVRFELTSPGF